MEDFSILLQPLRGDLYLWHFSTEFEYLHSCSSLFVRTLHGLAYVILVQGRGGNFPSPISNKFQAGGGSDPTTKSDQGQPRAGRPQTGIRWRRKKSTLHHPPPWHQNMLTLFQHKTGRARGSDAAVTPALALSNSAPPAPVILLPVASPQTVRHLGC